MQDTLDYKLNVDVKIHQILYAFSEDFPFIPVWISEGRICDTKVIEKSLSLFEILFQFLNDKLEGLQIFEFLIILLIDSLGLFDSFLLFGEFHKFTAIAVETFLTAEVMCAFNGFLLESWLRQGWQIEIQGLEFLTG